jgi:hypothetical protein
MKTGGIEGNKVELERQVKTEAEGTRFKFQDANVEDKTKTKAAGDLRKQG